MTELTNDRFSIELPDDAELVEELADATSNPVNVWRYIGPRSLFWTVSLHRPSGSPTLALGQVFGTVMAQYRQRPQFTQISLSEMQVDSGEALAARVVFRDSENEPLRVDVVALDVVPGEVLMLQLAVPGWETFESDWMTDALATLRIT